MSEGWTRSYAAAWDRAFGKKHDLTAFTEVMGRSRATLAAMSCGWPAPETTFRGTRPFWRYSDASS